MDERFPCIPMLKWDHMMLSPPMFCYVPPKSETFDSVVDESSNTNLLLGSHSSQEITLIQYSGKWTELAQSLLLTHTQYQCENDQQCSSSKLRKPLWLRHVVYPIVGFGAFTPELSNTWIKTTDPEQPWYGRFVLCSKCDCLCSKCDCCVTTDPNKSSLSHPK